LNIKTIIRAVRKRHKQAIKQGYTNHSEKILQQCTLKSPKEVFDFLSSQLQLIQHGKTAEIPEISREYALQDCFSVIHSHFNLDIIKEGEKFIIKDGKNIVGYFYVHMLIDSDMCWFEIEEPINGVRCGSLGLPNDASYTTWHEMGHCLHHILRDIETVSPDLWEFGGILFERLAAQFYQFKLPTYPQLKEIAISILDLELSLRESITEQELIQLVEHIQDYVGVDILIDELDQIIGQYGGCYFTYPWSRYIVG
jgi:hypothetical protein